MIKKMKQKSHEAFTLIEMLIVLFVLAVLILIFVPNLSKQREGISKQEDAAFEQVIVNQIELYALNETEALDDKFATLQSKGYLTKKQTEKAVKTWVDIPGFNTATANR